MSNVRKAKHGWIFTIIFTILSVLWVLPIVIVFMNSFKLKAYINRFPFQLGPFKMTDGWDRFVAGVQKAFVGLTNYAEGIRKINFFNAFGTSLFITICSVAVIILCTSMCAWYIIRVNDKFSKGLYCLCLFSMIVPFQMVMFTLSKLSNMLHLGNPVGIILVYLGFGAGLAVFMFTGFVKSIPLEIEEAAMIDGCSPIQTYFQVVFPILKPSAITVAILQVMWIWNDYLLPFLVIGNKTGSKTLTLELYFAKLTSGQYGNPWELIFPAVFVTIIPIIILYIFLQKYIVAGVSEGAVKM